MDYSDRQVIVTGGTGALGSAVVGALVEAGATCYVPWRHETEAQSNTQKVTIHFQPKPRLRNRILEYNFGELMVKGRESKGNLISENAVEKILKGN